MYSGNQHSEGEISQGRIDYALAGDTVLKRFVDFQSNACFDFILL